VKWLSRGGLTFLKLSYVDTLSKLKSNAELLLLKLILNTRTRDSAVSIATGSDRGVGVRIPTVQKFSLLHSVQTGSGAHTVSCPMGTRGS
jgi:hypothetical protein